MKRVLEYTGYLVIGFILFYLLGWFMNWAACSNHNRSWGVVGGTSVTCYR